jgi:hypothetical protein
MDFYHNMTKQGGLPTVRRREPEKGDLSMTCVLHLMGAKVETLGNLIFQFKYAFVIFLGVGWRFLYQINSTLLFRNVLIWNALPLICWLIN